MTENFMKSYDCIIYGFKDNTHSNNEKENVIKSYINSGGSFLITHDKWGENNAHLKLLDLVRFAIDYKITLSTKAKVSRYGHPIFDSYHNLTD